MPVLPIVTYNNPVLREKTNVVNKDSDELQEMIDNMFETMYNANGVGLAAPQIGSKHRLFVIDADIMDEDREDAEIIGATAFINPEIEFIDEENVVDMEEGCLSLPELRDKVSRPVKIKVTYLNQDFEKQELIADYWLSRVIQHEFDHLNGVLFIDHLSKFRQRLVRKKLEAIDKGKLDAGYPVMSRS
jgi:peptide deformylase